MDESNGNKDETNTDNHKIQRQEEIKDEKMINEIGRHENESQNLEMDSQSLSYKEDSENLQAGNRFLNTCMSNLIDEQEQSPSLNLYPPLLSYSSSTINVTNSPCNSSLSLCSSGITTASVTDSLAALPSFGESTKFPDDDFVTSKFASGGPESEPVHRNLDVIRITLQKEGSMDIIHEVSITDTVLQVKISVAEKLGIPPESQCLVLDDQVLLNREKLTSYGIKDGQILKVFDTTRNIRGDSVCTSSTSSTNASVVGNTSETSSKSTVEVMDIKNTSSPSSISSMTSSTESSRSPTAAATTNLSSSTSSTALSGLLDLFSHLDLQQMTSSNRQGLMNELINSPIVSTLMGNHRFLSFLLESNPQLNELRRRNPELNHILNDPQTLRQSMELMRNPSLMREMMRSSDRAMNNIEAIPGGFNALRRMYHNIQEPMWNATVDGNLMGSSDIEYDRMSCTYDMKTGEPPNTEALPNPWAMHSTESSSLSSTSSILQNFSNQDIMSLLSSYSSTSLLSSTSPYFSSNSYTTNENSGRLGIMSNNLPSIMANILIQNLASRALESRNQNGSSYLTDVASSMGLSSLSSSMFDNSFGTTTSSYSQVDLSNLASLSQNSIIGDQNALAEFPAMMNEMRNMNLGSRSTNQISENLEIVYQSQLHDLRSMGFTDTQACIRALQKANGNINGAIDRLLEDDSNS